GGMGGMMGGMGGAGGRQRTASGTRPLIPLNQVLQQQQQLGQALSADQVQALNQAITSGDTNAAAAVLQGATGRRITIHVTVLRRQNKLLVRTADEAAMGEVRELVKRLDVPTAMVLLEVKVFRVRLGDGITSAFDYSWNSGGTKGQVGGGFARGPVLPVNPVVPTAPGFSGLPGGSGFAGDSFVAQYFGENVRARMELLESKDRLNQVASPVLLTANNEVSRIFVGEEVPITRGFTGGSIIPSGNGTVAQNPNAEIEFRPVGTTLMLTPNINADRTVTIRIVQENSTLNKDGGKIPVPTANGGFVNQAVDTVQSRTVSGAIVARDNEAVVVGGLIEDQVTRSRTGLPFISRVPVLGVPFRRDVNSSVRNELVLVITPYIMSTPAEGEGISQRVAERLSLAPDARVLSAPPGKSYNTNDVPSGRFAPEEMKKKRF
ncbi:MAG: type II secretion system protein GspD, partial [Verrucomicrobiota bacterium]